MAKRHSRRAPARAEHQIDRRQTVVLTDDEKQVILDKFRRLKGPARTFVTEIFNQAKDARGRLDDDVYGVLRATLEALKVTGGMPPPLVFGVSHFETGKVEQVGFVPDGIKEIQAGGKFVTNHPGLSPTNVKMPKQLGTTRPSRPNPNARRG